jgi:uncharacterized protein YdeI (YjbR/CyaY-like superfamily)
MLTVADADAWARWLDYHAGQSDGVWLTLAKKRVTHPTELSYEDALAEALCHGWVDGQLARNDEKTFRRKFTPRQPRSSWSKRNVEIAEQLIANGRMRPSGLAAVSRARENGAWDSAYEAQSKMEVPPDLASALKAVPAGKCDVRTAQWRQPVLDPAPGDHGKAPRHTSTPDRAVRLHAQPWRNNPPSAVSCLALSVARPPAPRQSRTSPTAPWGQGNHGGGLPGIR